jgi:FtsP/CotA-like multicopper oxidase with cupredoxin domain
LFSLFSLFSLQGARTVTRIAYNARVLLALTLLQLGLAAPALGQHTHAASMDTVRVGALPSGRMIMPMIRNPMLPGLENVGPSVAPFLPGAGLDLSELPPADTRQVVELENGDTLELEASVVRKVVAGKAFAMYAFNRQIPGPLIEVDRESTIHVRFTNRIDQPTTVHWHGVRLDNRFDGVPGVTQDPVQPGETFDYTVHFPDAGVYWYHPHVREDIQQDLGLYGNMLVRSEREGYYNPVHREEVVVLDDILLEGDELLPFGREAANFVIMGRFGNVLLINGEQRYDLTVKSGEVVRFYLTNVSNTRTFNLSFGGSPIKLVGADIGKFEREIMVPGVAIAPAQRYVVEVLFEQPGERVITNRIQAVNHMAGRFFSAVDTLGVVRVEDAPASPTYAGAFRDLKVDAEVRREVEPYRRYIDAPVDQELLLSVEVRDLPIQVMQFIAIDTVYRSPVELTDVMSHMNWLSTSKEVRWILKDRDTGAENMDIDWRFRVGDIVKIRLRNDPKAFHPMNHPVHLHGQRFLVLSRDGVPNRNLAWILLEVTNPGSWMLHCHIAEHLEAGMMMAFEVEPDA